ncbi:MAG: alpha/beta fold hydrolase [Cyanobacteria bacterium TGS_CYA1]|nr:alpha/beta fold hydrolase [Cyanobacteria bacterium TGS_CYA1]
MRPLISAFLLLLLFLHSGYAMAEGAENQSIGLKCKEDPSCVVIGGTHILEWRSASPSNIIVVCIHGLGMCARAYKPLAKDLADAGIDGYGINVRGFGPDRTMPEREKLDCVQTLEDVKSLLRSVRNKEPKRKIVVIGESMGGALAMRLAVESPELVDAVVCSAPAWKIVRLKRTIAKGVVELFLLPSEKPGMASKGIVSQATRDDDLTEHLLQDSSHKIKLGFGEARAFLKFISKTDRFAKRLNKPILVIQGLNDRLVPPMSVAKLYREIPSDHKVFLIDAKSEHLILEEGGYSQELLEYVLTWLKKIEKENLPVSEIGSIGDKDLTSKKLMKLQKLKLNAQG